MSEPILEYSPLNQELSSGGGTVSVEIFRLEGEREWTMQLVDEYSNCTVWDDTFPTDAAALVEAKKAILEETISSFIGPADGKPADDWK